MLLPLADRDALVVGDAVFTLRNFREAVLPYRTYDAAAYARSVSEVRR